MAVVPQSGLLFVAAEQPKVLAFFVPALGPAPKWCSFLDNLTEELEEAFDRNGPAARVHARLFHG